MKVPMLDLVAQHQTIRDEVLKAVSTVVDRQAFIMGAEVAALEAAVAQVCATRFAVGCASGTDALLLPLRALGLEPGDEVI
ncbi:MAG TPA: DegT/DnrJ/EryC1/StrS family aminotransferase, partial [Gemmatimonadales bacterium]|nr:DegT/DnrJ/EryC1/StrS family aminotransferase [Gemmatimonadales bacterium]